MNEDEKTNLTPFLSNLVGEAMNEDEKTNLTPFVSRTKDEIERDEIASEIANARMTLDAIAYQNMPPTLEGRVKLEVTRMEAERRLQLAYQRKNSWVTK